MTQLNYLVLDIENDSQKLYGRDAGNFLYDRIVAIGLARHGQSDALYYTDGQKFTSWWTYLQATEVIVGHNIKHDMLFLWKTSQLQEWLKQGGIIWDTQLVEYILSNYKNKYPALRDIAVQKYGCKERVKYIDALLFDKKNTLNIPQKFEILQAIITEYDILIKKEDIEDYKQVSDLPRELVIEDVKSDVLDTETVFLKQYEEVQKRGLMDVIRIENETLLAIIEMEYNGFKIDKQRLEMNKKKIEIELEKCYTKLNEIVEKYWRTT